MTHGTVIIVALLLVLDTSPVESSPLCHCGSLSSSRFGWQWVLPGSFRGFVDCVSGSVAAHPLREHHHTLPFNHLHQLNTNMGIRDKKKFKHLLAWSEGKSDKTGSDAGGKRVDPGGPLVRPLPLVAAGGDHDRGANGEASSSWKSTTSAAAKLLLRGVRDSAAVFGPLQSVAGGLCFILENCEVCPFLSTPYLQAYSRVQKTKANKRAIESLAPRVKALAESLYLPVSEGDIREESRRKMLER